ncbi:MAG: DUF2809 domain-containing protein [Clostridia bacterium]|nr:DUF2809 domain-containing protein [Clostridia bacterium]
MHPIRRRLPYLCAILTLCACGLAVRHWYGVSPSFFNTYFPDAAWTMAVYCGLGLLFDRGVRLNLPASLGISYLVECSQLFSPPFLTALRRTTLGGLVLGYGFLWSDLICYTVGALLCAGTETALRKTGKGT